jgi:hypothetical protein
MQLTDAPNISGFETGIRIWNASSSPTDCTLVVAGEGKRKDIPLVIPPLQHKTFMLSSYMPEGVYGVALLGNVSGAAQYSQDGRYYASSKIEVWP